eukprot:TRINITY_DN6029_c0_g1_i2.p1 TRINITY_DN6029_c0_g1~~TRINITY_DN6029_c0_g1_i2.p1  ORF type:complete len:470 (-),score=77.81 TRINITY_DN6029_c0_g1_i2:129-1430(-)
MATPFLYEVVASHTLRWPSLSVQWLPSPSSTLPGDAAGGYTSKQLLVGANSSEDSEGKVEPYTMKILDVSLPPRFSYDSLEQNQFSQSLTGTCVKMRVAKSFEVPHEIHRIRCMPQMPSVVALKTAGQEVEIYNNIQVSDSDGDVQMTVDEPGVNNKKSAPAAAVERVKLENNKPHLLTGHTSHGWGLSWSTLEKGRLVSGSEDRAICVWDAQAVLDGQTDSVRPLLMLEKAHEDSVCDVSWNYFERALIASVGDDHKLRLWDTRLTNRSSGSCQNGHEDQINSCSWSPFSPHLIATASVDKTVIVWDVRKLDKPMQKLVGHKSGLNFVTWSPFHPGVLASCGLDRRVFVWDLTRTGRHRDAEAPSELLFVHGGHIDAVSELQWCPDQEWMVASVDEDNVCQVWEMAHAIHEDGNNDSGPVFFRKDLVDQMRT